MLYFHLQRSGSGNENKPTQTSKCCKGSVCPVSRPRSRPSCCLGASPWCWNIPPRPERPHPVGRSLDFPTQKLISKRKRPHLLCIPAYLQTRKENICVIALQLLFFNDEKAVHFSTDRESLKNSCQLFKWESLLLQGNQESPGLCWMLKWRHIFLQATGSMAMSSLH